MHTRVAAGWLTGPDHETHALLDGERVVGLVRLLDLDDDTAEFDLRVRSADRGRGLGAAAVRWLSGHVFTSRACHRVEAMTREDNVAMRAVLARCGWVQEARHRQAWPTRDGRRLDAVGYAVLRPDWEAGTVTPVDRAT
ncbi:MAG: Acetyltransferase family protein [Klenkia sp.]|nr:Acetyltransferase family protein [Klenkia sp.]